MKRDLITLFDYTATEIQQLLESSAKFKRDRTFGSQLLLGKSIGLIFQKPSNRTRVSFEVGVNQLGGNCIYLGPEEINLGERESTTDVAKTLSRYLSALVARTHAHKVIVELAEQASIPIINGLSDLYHPCQALADLLTVQETFKNLKGLTLAYIGDGNNVCHSLLIGCSKLGIHMRIATPKGYEPLSEIVKSAQTIAKKSGAQIKLTHSPQEAVKSAQVIYSDVWVSMGQEKEAKKRLKIFQNYQVNKKLLQSADKDHIFMHCLPAHRGEEVSADVIDGKHSVVFDQAENRLHVQKAVLAFLLKTK